MVRQAQTYFTAAVWAAALNAAAVAAFVLFMVLSSVHGWPIRTLLGLADPAGSSSATPVAAPAPGGLGSGGLFGVRGLTGSRPGGGAANAGGNTRGFNSHLSGPGPGRGGGSGGALSGADPSGTSGAAPVAPGGGASGPLGPSAPIAGAPIAGGPSLPLPTTPLAPTQPSAVQQAEGTVSTAPATVGDTVGSTLQGADSQLGGALSGAGISPTVKSTTTDLAGPDSTLGRAVSSGGSAL